LGAGLAAVRLGRGKEAELLLTEAIEQGLADWRAWNALGVIQDKREDYEASAASYQRAAEAAPHISTVWNNLGYSHLLQNNFPAAQQALYRARSLDPNNHQITHNLEIVNGALGQEQVRGETGSGKVRARTLNNWGVGAWLAGDLPRARGLFARALMASEHHFIQAETNLKSVETILASK
jgi:tetratricopeptide (TPR) repeat protein